MKQIGHLKVNGAVYRRGVSRAEERLKKYLSSMADDELLQIMQLARTGEFSTSTIGLAKDQLIQLGLACRHGARVYYGSKKAIASLKVILNQPLNQP